MKISTLVTRGIVIGSLLTYGILLYQLKDIPSNSRSDADFVSPHFRRQHRQPEQDHQETVSLASCSPVEANVSFPYGIAASSDGAASSSCEQSASAGGTVACAVCQQTDWVRYLSQLENVVRDRFQHECSQLVVFSVAFGAKHESFLQGPNWHQDSDELLERHGHCFFAFVLESSAAKENRDRLPPDDDPPYYLSPSFLFERKGLNGLFHLIPVPTQVFPYQNPRRNTKLFKLYGGLHLFDFAEHIVWQDAKLQKKQWAQYPGARNYTKFTKQHSGVCVSVKSLPSHETSLGPGRRPRFQSHCQVLLSTNHTRTVSDNLAAVQRQCTLYPKQQEQRRKELSVSMPERISLDDGLIDSALIYWNNNRNNFCRHFNLELSCRWVSEIHCHGDRDQISFPQVVGQMGLVQQPGRRAVHPGETTFLDKLLVEKTTRRIGDNSATVWEPRIHMDRSLCHWYHSRKNVLDCPSNVPGLQQQKETDVNENDGQSSSISSSRIAIVVVGTLQRYSLNATLEHLIRPLVFEQGHAVDIFVSLTTKSAPPFRSEFQYMAHVTWDPLLLLAAGKAEGTPNDKSSNSHQSLAPPLRLEQFIQYHMSLAGAVPRRVHVHETIPNWEDDPGIQRLHERASWKFPSPQDPHFRFPVRDQRPSAQNRTDQADRNILTVFYALQKLWQEVVETETNLGVPYDYVLFLRDDARFLQDWDLKKLLLLSNTKKESDPVDAFILSCDASVPPMHPLEINDYGGLYPRKNAGIYGEYWKALLQPPPGDVMEQCAAQLERAFRQQRGCNSEMLLRWILLHQHNLTNVQMVGQALLPFQRAVHVQLPDGTVQACFHKYCQSQQDPILTNGTIKECADLKF